MTNNIYTLAIDSANDSISVALLRDSEILTHDYKKMDRGQGEALIPMIQDIVKKAKIKFSDLSRVAVSIGPGSFTGVRIGLASAKGIGLSLAIPVYGVSSLKAVAFQISGKTLAVLDSKRGDFFTQLFENGMPKEEPCIRTIEQIQNLMPIPLVGSESEIIKNDIDCQIVSNGLTPAEAVGLCSLTDYTLAEPMYLRDADVSC